MAKFYNWLNDFKKFTPYLVLNTKEKKKIVYNDPKNLYNKLLSIYYDDYINISDKEKGNGWKIC